MEQKSSVACSFDAFAHLASEAVSLQRASTSSRSAAVGREPFAGASQRGTTPLASRASKPRPDRAVVEFLVQDHVEDIEEHEPPKTPVNGSILGRFGTVTPETPSAGSAASQLGAAVVGLKSVASNRSGVRFMGPPEGCLRRPVHRWTPPSELRASW